MVTLKGTEVLEWFERLWTAAAPILERRAVLLLEGLKMGTGMVVVLGPPSSFLPSFLTLFSHPFLFLTFCLNGALCRKARAFGDEDGIKSSSSLQGIAKDWMWASQERTAEWLIAEVTNFRKQERREGGCAAVHASFYFLHKL